MIELKQWLSAQMDFVNLVIFMAKHLFGHNVS